MRTATDLIDALALTPHPEGGYYRETYRSTLPVALDDLRGPRSALTAIYFLLDTHQHSRLHRVASDEVWHHVEGAPMQLTLLSPTLDTVQIVTVGPLSNDQHPVTVIPAGWWQGARPVGGHSLCSCLVAPGFEFQDFCFMDNQADRDRVSVRFPELTTLL